MVNICYVEQPIVASYDMAPHTPTVALFLTTFLTNYMPLRYVSCKCIAMLSNYAKKNKLHCGLKTLRTNIHHLFHVAEHKLIDDI